jgi:SAM-dependent methyltransferase
VALAQMTAWRVALLAFLAAARAAGASAQTPDVMFVPTNIDVALGMLRLAGVTAGDVVYDLGSGDGRLVIAAAQRFGARGVGIEIDPSLVADATRNADTAGVADRVSFRKADLFATDLRPASVVTLYLTPSLNLRLRPKLFAELRPGARVVSNNFDMGDWTPDSTVIVKGMAMANTPVRLWIIPARIGGRWQLSVDGGPELSLTFRQQLNQAGGEASMGGRRDALAEVRVRGDSFGFVVPSNGSRGAMRFSGRVAGDSASGTVLGGSAAPRAWRAVRTGPRSRRR